MSIAEGEITKIVYTLINEENYADAIDLLNQVMCFNSKNRAGLSLMGYCYYQLEDYENAAHNYEELVTNYPAVEHYRMTLAECYYKNGDYQNALKTLNYDFKPENLHDALLLQANIRYENEDLAGCKKIVARLLEVPTDDPSVYRIQGCCFYKESKLNDALASFEIAQELDSIPESLYAVALCHFRLGNYTNCVKTLRELVTRSAQLYPEFSYNVGGEGKSGPIAGNGTQSVGNSVALAKSALVEAYNLRIAVEWTLGSQEGAETALKSIPPRREEELDAVTLHNLALLEMEKSPAEGFRKIRHILQTPPFPPEAFGNLLLLYIKYDLHGLAADLLADNPILASSCLEMEELSFIEAVMDAQTSPERAYAKLDTLASKNIAILRRQQHAIQRSRRNSSGMRDDEIKTLHQAYEKQLSLFIPILMAQTGLLYDAGSFNSAETKLKQAIDFCNDNVAWHLNMGHTIFVQERDTNPSGKNASNNNGNNDHSSRFAEAARHYESVLEMLGGNGNILSVPAIALANLCASYVMMHRNRSAEALMQRIDNEEQELLEKTGQPNGSFHLCIVNIVIGILYCVKHHMHFGIIRVLKGLDPISDRLSPDTWMYAKRPLLTLLDQLSKRILVASDDLLAFVIDFLMKCMDLGSRISVDIVSTDTNEIWNSVGGEKKTKRTIADEARAMLNVLFKL